MNRLTYLIKRLLVRLKKGEIKEILNKIFQTLINDNKINLDKINLKNITNLNDIFLRFGSDKSYWDGKKTYEEILSNKKGDFKFKNYLDWINRENPNNFKYN